MRRHTRLDNPDREKLYATLEPIIIALERYRRGHIIFMLLMAVLFVPATGYLTKFLGFLFFGSGFPADVAGIVAAAMVMLVLYRIFDRDYRRMCKRRFNRQFAKALDIAYEPMGTFLTDDLDDHFILPGHARGLPQDSLTVIHNGRKIRMQEIIFTRADAFDVNILNPLTFGGPRGLVIRVPTRRHIKRHTLVVPRRAVASDRDKLRYPGLHYYERAPFGNRRFSEKYYVMSEDALEAHIVFDPAFIERVLTFEKETGARALYFSFFRDEIIIFADHAHDFLEAGHLLRPVTLARAENIITDLQTLAALIDSLELNEFTGV